MTLDEKILRDLKLSEKKYLHTLSVEKCAQILRERHFPRLSAEKTKIAAYMHDFTKEYSLAQQLELCKKYGLEVSDEEKETGKLLHSKTAAAIAEKIYGVDTETADAVYWHTTGRKNMSGLEIIIYFADYIEDLRASKSCVKVRDFYNRLINGGCPPEEALYRGLLFSFDTTIKNILEKNYIIHTPTFEARNWVIWSLNERKKSYAE